MITRIENVPDNIVAFKATKAVTKEDYDTVVFPAVSELVKRTGKLNYIMVIDTPLHNFTIGAWWKDALLGLKELSKWHRAAILTDSDGLNNFTSVVSVVLPGEFKGFKKEDLAGAVEWVAGK